MKPKSGGFTLIEVLLYAGLSGIVLFSLAFFLILILQSRTKNQVVAEVEQQGVLLLQRLTQVARNSVLVNAPAAGASAPNLSLNRPQASQSPTLFALSGGTVTVAEGAAAAASLTNDRVRVSGLTFTNLSRAGTPGTVRIQFTVNYVNNSGGRNEFDYSKTFASDASLRDN